MFWFASMAIAAEPTLADPVQVSETATITFSVLAVPDPERIGVVYRVSGDFREQVIEAMGAQGYETRGGENLALGEDTGHQARLVLGGVLSDGVCEQYGSTWSDCWVEIHWELFDTALGEVIYEQSVQGQWKGTPSMAIDRAVEGAIYGLLSEADFAEIASNPPEALAHEALTIESCPSKPLKLPKGLDSAQSRVLLVRTEDAVGTGVVVSPDGFAMTAAHVVRGHSEVEVELVSGIKTSAKVVRLDNAKDVALLHLPGEGYACTPLRESPAGLGEELWAIGNPMGEELSFSVTKGLVSGLRSFSGAEFIQTDAPINPGYSGGPLLDTTGNLLGIISWKVAASGVEGLSFGVPVESLIDSLNLSFGKTSDSEWAAYDGGTQPQGNSAVQRYRVDQSGYTPERPQSATTGSASTVNYNTPEVGMGPRRAVLATGLAMVLTTAAWSASTTQTTPSRWAAMTGVNTLGWALTATGATWVLIGRHNDVAMVQALNQAESTASLADLTPEGSP